MSDEVYLDTAAVRQFGDIAGRSAADVEGDHSTIGEAASLVVTTTTSIALKNLDSVLDAALIKVASRFGAIHDKAYDSADTFENGDDANAQVLDSVGRRLPR